ncbi:MAG: Fe2+-dependent dioxygenase [Rhodanobacter sp.]
MHLITFVPNVLTAEELGKIRTGLKSARYVEGVTSAGGAAREVKNNQQVASDNPQYEGLADIVRGAFTRNAMLWTALLPASVTRVIFNHYGQAMQYGPHVDSPLMGTMGDLLRVDIAVTLFLSDPSSYAGGELTVRNGGGAEQTFKEAAGSAIAYPANSVHHVTPVTGGARDAAILWVQSLVRDPAKRELLWDLDRAQRDLYGREGRTATFEAVSRSHANLLRMWADV